MKSSRSGGKGEVKTQEVKDIKRNGAKERQDKKEKQESFEE